MPRLYVEIERSIVKKLSRARVSGTGPGKPALPGKVSGLPKRQLLKHPHYTNDPRPGMPGSIIRQDDDPAARAANR
jgi:hypothetical protein